MIFPVKETTKKQKYPVVILKWNYWLKYFMQKIDDVNYDLRKLNGQHDHLNDVVRQLAEQLASTVGVVNVYAGIHQNKGYAVVIVDRNIREPDKLIPDDVEGIPVGYRISAPVYFRAARDKLYFPNIF